MPFRERSRLHYQRLVLPIFALTCLAMMIAWVGISFAILGGWGKATAAQRVFVFGFVGIPLFQVIGTVVTVFLLETTAYDNWGAVMARLQSLAAVGTIYVVDQAIADSLDDLARRLHTLGTVVIVRDKSATETLAGDSDRPSSGEGRA